MSNDIALAFVVALFKAFASFFIVIIIYYWIKRFIFDA